MNTTRAALHLAIAGAALLALAFLAAVSPESPPEPVQLHTTTATTGEAGP